MVGAADDMSDVHVHIVGHHAQVVSRSAIGAKQHEILEFGVGKLHAAEDSILENCAA